MLELIWNKTPGTYEKSSVWNCSGNYYYIDGKRIRFSVKDLKNIDADLVRKRYFQEEKNINRQYFDEYIDRFVKANSDRYEFIVKEATDYIRGSVKGYTVMDMFVSFSGGKDSTVTSDLVIRALSGFFYRDRQ